MEDKAKDLIERSRYTNALHMGLATLLEQVIDMAEGRVVPPGRDSHMTAAGEELAGRVETVYREAGFDAPSLRIKAAARA